MQVIGTTGWNKNLIAVEGAARSAQDVFEAQPALVRVPGAQWRSGDGAIAGALDEPDDERRVEQTNERRHAQDGLFFSGGGVSESEQLLCFSEKALDGPPGAISGYDRGDIERGVRREEDADRNRSPVGRNDDEAKESSAASPIPLGAQGLVANGLLAPVDEHLARLPGSALVGSDGFGLSEKLSALGRATAASA